MISVILPTYNEAANLPTLINFLDGALGAIAYEIIVVDDDSPDGTWRVAQNLAAQYPAIRVLRRREKRGLSSAVTDGFDTANGEILVVMDADGQHDADVLPRLLSAIQHGADIAIGSRYVPGGSVGDWVTDRRIISSIGTFFACRLSRVSVSDPLGGFFAIKRPLYRSVRPFLQPSGFKILLEILAFVPEKTVLEEVPLQFRMRLHGESKLSLSVHSAFLLQILRLFFSQIPRLFVRAGFHLFWTVSFIIAVTLIVRIVPILSLRDVDTRTSLTTALHVISEHQGWLLSDLSIRRVGRDSASIVYQEHRRNRTDALHCELLYLPPTLSCDTE